ncbi:MAG: D-alanyl-D-alanine carboxypeptidase [Actinomycetes bacterium]|jgi:D-alanyl-D-alanine carboxypeptidase|nr:D-alanyl-D-alanine carboxypeptidase [Actinomycetes bacterium]
MNTGKDLRWLRWLPRLLHLLRILLRVRFLILLVVVMGGSAYALPRVAVAVIKSTDQIDGVKWTERDLPRAAMPDVDCKAGCVVTADGRVLWSRALNSERAMASITKIMTAIVTIEESDPELPIVVPSIYAEAGESSAGLVKGEKMTRHELLEALLVKSGNDAAITAAVNVAGSEDAFVQLMNLKAADLGLEHTHFANPHGLDQDGHYTSAADIATMARYAMSLPDFRDIVGRAQVSFKTSKVKHTLHNTNILLQSYEGCNGVKTGWTDKAGYCVVDSAQRDGIEIYAVVLGTAGDLDRFFDARDLMDFGFAHFRTQELATSGTIIGRAKVSQYLERTVPVAVSTDTSAVVFDLLGDIERQIEVHPIKAPVHVGDVAGEVRYVQDGKLVASSPLVATKEVKRPFFLVGWYFAVVKLFK